MKNTQNRQQRNIKNFNRISDQLKRKDNFILLDALESSLEVFEQPIINLNF